MKPRLCNPAEYRTVRFPEQYAPNWRLFYEQSLIWTSAFGRKCRSQTGVSYGPNVYRVLDVFAPYDAARAPVLIFFHGGGFREGHPSHYGFLGEHFVADGGVFVSAGYRLDDDMPFGEIAEHAVRDGAFAVKWVVEHASGFGGDPERIFLVGHSAGAVIAARLSFDDEWTGATGLPKDIICGSAHLSGSYDLGISDPLYVDRQGQPSNASAVNRIEKAQGHVVVSYGVPEAQRVGQSLNFFQRQGDAFILALRQADCTPELVPLPDTDHLQVCMSLGNADSPLHAAVAAMVFAT